jgi:curved DNA-binding protein CbpA
MGDESSESFDLMSASISKSQALEELGLTENPSDLEIREAYRKLARLHHPDVDENGAEKMAAVNVAYERLTRHSHEPDPVSNASTSDEDPWAGFDNWTNEDLSTQSQNSIIGNSIYITIDVSWEAANLGRNHVVSYSVLGESRQITVKIPKGSAPGKRLRCAGKGEPGRSGGIAGDLFLTLNVINK